LSRASEPNNLFRYTILKKIRPIATMDSLIVGKPGSAWFIDGLTILAFSVVLFAWTSSEESKSIITWTTSNWLLVMYTAFAVGTPVVVAEVVDTAGTIEQEAILACLQGQCSVGTLVKLITVGGMVISLLAILLLADSDLWVDHCRCWGRSCLSKLTPMLGLRCSSSHLLPPTTTLADALLWRCGSESE